MLKRTESWYQVYAQGRIRKIVADATCAPRGEQWRRAFPYSIGRSYAYEKKTAAHFSDEPYIDSGRLWNVRRWQRTECGWRRNSHIQAVVLEIHDGYYLVEPVEGSAELNSADRITIPMTDMDSPTEPEVGNILEIEYDGSIAESYPAQIMNVYSIHVIE